MNLRKKYQMEVLNAFRIQERYSAARPALRGSARIPAVVLKYMKYTGSEGNHDIRNLFVRAKGKIRSAPDASWMNFRAEQHNFFTDPSRFFYMRALKAGIPAVGLHVYKSETATMQVRLAGLFRIADARGPEMDRSETVTFLNDICLMAPGRLLGTDLVWEEISPLSAKVTYVNGKLTVSAILSFDNDGRLTDFISYDRYETVDGRVYRSYPWRTPVQDYGIFHGFRLPSKAETIYERPGGDFCYGIFELEEVSYNKPGML